MCLIAKASPVLLIRYSWQVQSGGSFDVDYTVTGPGDKIIMEDSKERQLDSVFTAKEAGEYRFCFNNEMSTFAEKMVDFEIAVRFSPPPLDPFFCKTFSNPSQSCPINSLLIPTTKLTKVSLPGRERVPLRPASCQARHLPRTNHRA